MKDQKITACDIELAVARMFNFRANLIVPNVSWGLNLGWEADLLVLRPSGYLIEVEIKTTKNDLLKDRTKTKWGQFGLNKIIKYHFYAVPETLAELVWRMDSGIISVSLFNGKYWAKIVRPAKIVKGVQPLKSDRRQKLAELGAMRIWDLKETLLKRREKEESKEKGGE